MNTSRRVLFSAVAALLPAIAACSAGSSQGAQTSPYLPTQSDSRLFHPIDSSYVSFKQIATPDTGAGSVAVNEYGHVFLDAHSHLLEFHDGSFNEFAYPYIVEAGFDGPAAVALGPAGGVWLTALVPGGGQPPQGVVLTLPFKSSGLRAFYGPQDSSDFLSIAPAWNGKMWIINDTSNPENDNASSTPNIFTVGPKPRNAIDPPIDWTNAEALGSDKLMYLATAPQLAWPSPPPSEIFRYNEQDNLVDTIDLPSNSVVQQLAVGADGAMWFTDSGLNEIGRIAPDGTLGYYPIPTASAGLAGIAPAGDNAMWFTETSGNKIGRISMSGTVSEYVIPTANEKPQGISAGPIGHYVPNTVYFVDATGLGKITYRM